MMEIVYQTAVMLSRFAARQSHTAPVHRPDCDPARQMRFSVAAASLSRRDIHGARRAAVRHGDGARGGDRVAIARRHGQVRVHADSTSVEQRDVRTALNTGADGAADLMAGSCAHSLDRGLRAARGLALDQPPATPQRPPQGSSSELTPKRWPPNAECGSPSKSCSMKTSTRR